ncbi:pyrroline-5-carboxylate reductase [Periconia macrospinosa]|uniref:Pyrroline-5-carboxylate reductase n=1 Tax=Periconia macrospinosa TaxID=97972 RepID=A0A2V1D1E0_9PLEO|nr:pyrroline-5-carboxylate reductase [Periconia macrospinosa]
MPRAKLQITFIGGGTMTCAILDGLTHSTSASSSAAQTSNYEYALSILVRRPEHAVELGERYSSAYITCDALDSRLWHTAEESLVEGHIILICTKPQDTREVCETICNAYNAAPTPAVLPTIATMCPGITAATLTSWLGPPRGFHIPFPVVRTMPNTPVSVGQGATAMFAPPQTGKLELQRLIEFFRVVSPCVEVLEEESLLDVAAAVSGSGPAYLFAMYRALVAAGVEWGLSEHAARAMVGQTAVGAGILTTNKREISLSAMIGNVCVPGGSTEKGIRVLSDRGLPEAVMEAVGKSLEANHRMKQS